MNNLIRCDSCNGLINANQVNINDKTIKPGIQARVWKCPHCNHKHPIVVMDKTSRRMMNENRQDRIKIGNINKRVGSGKLSYEQAVKNLNKVDEIQARIDKRTQQLDERSKRLADEYKEAVR